MGVGRAHVSYALHQLVGQSVSCLRWAEPRRVPLLPSTRFTPRGKVSAHLQRRLTRFGCEGMSGIEKPYPDSGDSHSQLLGPSAFTGLGPSQSHPSGHWPRPIPFTPPPSHCAWQSHSDEEPGVRLWGAGGRMLPAVPSEKSLPSTPSTVRLVYTCKLIWIKVGVSFKASSYSRLTVCGDGP